MRAASHRIFRRIVEQPWYQAAKRVALFAAIRNEPELDEVLTDCRARGVRVAYPRVAGRGLRFAYVRSLQDLTPGAFGVLAPTGGEPVAVADLQLVLTPGLVFDDQGGRLGYGKGFYDRAFGGCSEDPLRVGVCWEQQVLPPGEFVPSHGGDALVDLIVTERRVIVCGQEPERGRGATGEGAP